LARYRLADLFLDTLPFNAHTTASDALWAGVPVLTCSGEAYPGRVAASLLKSIGLPELVTSSLEDYAELALKLGSTPTLTAELRAQLGRRRDTSSLFDTDRFRRDIESAYRQMWERVQQGAAAESFSVTAVDLR
jgi:predicted O-linked N-acetylglucosamine transferase (SPINDLY family)